MNDECSQILDLAELALLDAITAAKLSRVRKADLNKLEGALSVLQRLVSEGNK